MAEVGVNTGGIIEEKDSTTGMALIQIAEDGSNTIVVIPGANHRLMPPDLKQFADIFRSAGMLVLQNEIPLETNLAACRSARESGATIIYNPAPFRPGSEDICLLSDHVVLNEIELSGLVGRELSDLADLEEAAKTCFSRFHNKTVIVTLGAQGSVLITTGSTTRHPARPVKATDTTAAGDAFISGFVSALARRHTIYECMRVATDVSAYAVTVIGAQPSLPTRCDLECFLGGEPQDKI